MAEFSPSELDQLEDRLEDLTATTDVASLGLPPAVAEEMEAYREVLDLVEAHLVEEEPTAGVLDDVLAKAHAEVASGSTSTTPVATTRASKDRRWWMPALALVGVSAAVLILVQPDQAMEDGAPAEAVVAAPSVESAPAVDELEDALARAPAPMEEGALEPEAPAAANALAQKTERGEVDGAPTDADVYEAKSAVGSTVAEASMGGASGRREKSAAPARGRSKVAPPPKPKQARAKKKSSVASKASLSDQIDPFETNDSPAAASPFGETSDPKNDWGDSLMRAHQQRRRGQCGAAMSSYKILARYDEVGDALLGEVYGGMGLCAEVSGSLSTAKSYFDKARRLKPGLDAWLTSERGRTSTK